MKVSVVIPVYNQQDLVIRCIKSIPIREDVEIIVVNDGSTDSTERNLEELKLSERNKLRIISYNPNAGVSCARNKGLEMAKGEYILFVDSDDYINGTEFNIIIDNYLKDADMVYYDMANNCGIIYPCNENTYKTRWGMFKFIRKDFIGKTRFRAGVQYGEDRIFTIDLLNKNPKVLLTNRVMYYYNYPRRGSLSAIREHRY